MHAQEVAVGGTVAGPYLQEGDHPKRSLHWLHLGVFCQQHVLDSRLAVVQRAVPRHVVTAAKGVFCKDRKQEIFSLWSLLEHSFCWQLLLTAARQGPLAQAGTVTGHYSQWLPLASSDEPLNHLKQEWSLIQSSEVNTDFKIAHSWVLWTKPPSYFDIKPLSPTGNTSK